MQPPMGPPMGMGGPMGYPMGMSPPPTNGSLHFNNTPNGPPMMPPYGMGGPPSGPPTAASLGPSMMPPPMSGMMPPPMMGGSHMPAPMTGNMPPPMMAGQNMDPHMGAPMHGFGPQMHHMPEVRHAPLRGRPEHMELPEGKKKVNKHAAHLPDGTTLPSGSNKFDLYGALEDFNATELCKETQALRSRRRLNCIPAMISLFLPWAVFLITYSVASFWIHYSMPGVVVLTNTTLVTCAMAYAYSSYKKERLIGPERAFYPSYLSVMFLASVSLGWLLGDLNFWFNMQPAYSIDHLATYNNVNPSTSRARSGEMVPTRGKRYQDAGKIYFEHNAVIDVNRSMSFKMGDLYCVAPIVDPNCKKNCGYDFWAVGINCCAEDVADFRCGEYKNPAAKNGLRLMHDEQRPNFRLAVLQAEGVHKVVSTHPLFFYWLHDPVKEIQHIKRKGFRGFVLLMIVSFFGFGAASYLSLKRARDVFRAD